jgi:hypothetical protein
VVPPLLKSQGGAIELLPSRMDVFEVADVIVAREMRLIFSEEVDGENRLYSCEISLVPS